MRLVIDDTDNLSELDKDILALVLGEEFVEEEAPVQPAAEVMKKEAAAVSKKATEAKPKPEPEPMAEEPLPDEPVDVDADVEEEPEDDGTSDEDLLEMAVKKATEMVGSGDAAKVREALDAAGASRVRELNKDNVREFFKALS